MFIPLPHHPGNISLSTYVAYWNLPSICRLLFYLLYLFHVIFSLSIFIAEISQGPIHGDLSDKLALCNINTTLIRSQHFSRSNPEFKRLRWIETTLGLQYNAVHNLLQATLFVWSWLPRLPPPLNCRSFYTRVCPICIKPWIFDSLLILNSIRRQHGLHRPSLVCFPLFIIICEAPPLPILGHDQA